MNPNTRPLRAPAGANAFAKSLVVKASAGFLASLCCYNSNGSDRYLQIFDAAALPADTAVPLQVVKVPAASTASFDFNSASLPFTNGLVACLSTTDTTKTIVAANDGLFTAVYQ